MSNDERKHKIIEEDMEWEETPDMEKARRLETARRKTAEARRRQEAGKACREIIEEVVTGVEAA